MGIAADRRAYAAASYNAVRESAARTLALVDAYVIGRAPAIAGQTIPIDGSARATHDSSTSR